MHANDDEDHDLAYDGDRAKFRRACEAYEAYFSSTGGDNLVKHWRGEYSLAKIKERIEQDSFYDVRMEVLVKVLMLVWRL